MRKGTEWINMNLNLPVPGKSCPVSLCVSCIIRKKTHFLKSHALQQYLFYFILFYFILSRGMNSALISMYRCTFTFSWRALFIFSNTRRNHNNLVLYPVFQKNSFLRRIFVTSNEKSRSSST